MAIGESGWFVALLIISAICGLSVGLPASAAPPQWPAKYMVTGMLRLPYAELNEPFVGYFDSTGDKSRIDYYGDTVQTIQIGQSKESTDFGHTYMIAPMTTYKVYNERSCFQTNGSDDGPVSAQPTLPDLTHFKLLGDGTARGVSCYLWQNVTNHGSKTSTYTMYVEVTSGVPVMYEMMGYDSLFGSHYDKYYLEYDRYSTSFDDSVFNVPDGLKCGGFPGPGLEHQVLANPMQEFIHGHAPHLEPMFSVFRLKHGKTYTSDIEEAQRKANFHANLRFIHSKNRAGLTYTLAVNHLADKTQEELSVLRGRRHSNVDNNGGKEFHTVFSPSDVPDQYDWRLYGAVTPVKDQAVCGSCWSFGTTGTIEGAMFLKTGQLARLSQQELMDCSWGEGNNGCDGGEDFRAYNWIMKNGGLATEDDYGAYMAVDGYCHSRNVTKYATLKGFVNVTSGDLGALKVAIATKGPISVGIDASHPSLAFYANGVYYEPACGNKPDDLDHAVLAVGYGTMNGQDYWLVKNSWSTYWGNIGYVLMSQKDNNCGVATDASYPIV